MAHTLEEMVVLVEQFNEVDHTLTPNDVERLVSNGFTPELYRQFIEKGTNAETAGRLLNKALKRLDQKVLRQITSKFKKVKYPRKAKKRKQKQIISMFPAIDNKTANKLAYQSLLMVNALNQFNVK